MTRSAARVLGHRGLGISRDDSSSILRCAAKIAYLSQSMTLLLGDIVTTGTRAGVGAFQNPRAFMKAGYVIEIEAAGIGVVRNSVVAATEGTSCLSGRASV